MFECQFYHQDTLSMDSYLRTWWWCCHRHSGDDVVNIGRMYKCGWGTCPEKTKAYYSYCEEDKYCYI